MKLTKSFSYTKLGDMVRIRKISNEVYEVFINDKLVDDVVYDKRDELINYIKDKMTKIKDRINIYGFCKIKVYYKKGIGIFLEVIKFDDSVSTTVLDLRVLIMENEKIYFETEDYEIIKNCNDKRYMDERFYCIVDDSFDLVLEKVEFGNFIYGKDVIKVLNNSKILC